MRTWALLAGATLSSVVFVLVMHLSDPRGPDATAVSDVAQLTAAVLASAGCAVGARRSRGPRRRAWLFLAAAAACWAAGQTVWSFYEVALSRHVPFPSIADAGYLCFPLFAGIGLFLMPAGESDHAITRGRDLMDGAIIALSLFALSWVSVMAPLVDANEVLGTSLVLSLAYPVGDVVLGTLVLLLLSRSQTERLPLTLLALGLALFTLADSLFSYLTSEGTYTSTNAATSGGWVAGFLLMAVAGATVTGGHHPADQAARPRQRRSFVWLLVPYLPLFGACIALLIDLTTDDPTVLVDLVLTAALVCLVLLRQFLALFENRRLMAALGDALEAERDNREALAHTNLELSAVNAAVADLVAMLSHDLRTPLTVMLGYTDFAIEAWDDLTGVEQLNIIRKVNTAGHDLRELLEATLTVSALEGNGVAPTPVPVRVDQAVTAALATTPGLPADVDVTELNAHTADVDEGHLAQVLTNLLTNAAKYGAGPITLSTAADDHYVLVRVSDSGPGVPPAFVPRLFDRFSRSDEVRQGHQKGSGLGLYITRSLMRANGGDITYEPSPHGGASFVLHLRASATVADGHPARHEAAAQRNVGALEPQWTVPVPGPVGLERTP